MSRRNPACIFAGFFSHGIATEIGLEANHDKWRESLADDRNLAILVPSEHLQDMNARNSVIIIKKYPNRRLYDTSQSQYVNLEAIKTMVMKHQEFQIIDSKTEEDLTKSILLQIISEQETNENQSVLTNQLLKQLIRFYDSDMQVFLRMYLEQSMANFLDQQDAMQSVMQNIIDSSPMGMFGQMFEKNMDFWRNIGSSASPSNSDKNSKE
ncbi:polyhydroxyalkanoate synthesis repressor PhaR [Marinibactrum halimedae]|uniref:Uncharacterized protein n=1 Tax=Marinibactrum halimedae TaxID=1444977 RepID=A0AA37TC22_9GAMM|nr:polyhydroxyalkanoate synthesis repressor PhaR [Marinibactrum halimedae]MCD9459397.1 polyhydroxyalkanoate synthesis repressor PhaR [Marinibactrum halimedae]GLS27536.1 hypothetical protein GCM10007877_32550 [Marinibactrum halimedae]